MLITYRTYNSIVRFLKYEFYNKLLRGRVSTYDVYFW